MTMPRDEINWQGRNVSVPAKLRPPAARFALITRPRLIEVLTRALDGRITIITAPGGYGKTSLLTDFARDLDRPACWYTLGYEVARSEIFLRNLVVSVRQEFSTFGQRIWEDLQGEVTVDAAMIRATAAEMSYDIPNPFVLILDDFHCLNDSPDTLKVLDALLPMLPEHCHLILAGRTWPKLSTLPLMVARQQATKIDASDLAFDSQELSHFLAEVLHKPTPDEAAQKLAEETEGWPGAVILVMEDVASSSSGLLLQFLEAELWSMQEPRLQDFMQRTGVLRRLEPTVCDALLGTTDAQQILAALARDCLVTELTDGGTYRYHRLLQRFLIEKLRTETPDELTAMHRKAAIAYEGSSSWGEAIYHYAESGGWDEIGHILDEKSDELLEQGRWPELMQWLDAIPAHMLDLLPRALILRARVLLQVNELDHALQVIHRATPLLMARNDWPAVAEALIIQATCLRLKGDYDAAIDACNKACSLLVQEGGSVTVLAEARKELGITYGMAGQLNKAVQELKAALDVYEAKGDSVNIAQVSDPIGSALMLMGRLSEGASYLEKAYQRWRRLGNQLRQVQTLNNLGVLYFFQGDYDKAEDALREALQKAEEQGRVRFKAYIIASIADIERHRGQHKAAMDLYQRCLDVAHEIEETYLAVLATDGIANIYRLQGELAKAETTIEHAIGAAEDRGGFFELGICQTTLGLINIDKGDLKEGVACLEKAANLLAEGDAKRELATAHFYLAEANYRLHKRTAAAESLRKVAALAQELGHFHFLASAIASAPYLVQYAIALKIGGGFYNRLLPLLKDTTEDTQEDTPESRSLPLVEAYALGDVRTVIDGREVTDLEWRSEKSKEMFFYFLTHPRPLTKDEVVVALWPDLPEEKCNSAFHSNLYRLRQALYNDCIVKQGGRYYLNPQGRFWYDVAEFQGLVRASETAEDGSPEWIEATEKALALYRGPFADSFYLEWAEGLRWQLAEQQLRLASALAAQYLEKGKYTRASELYHRILQQDEYNEAAWYRLMRAYLENDQVEAAKYCYQRYSELLETLGEAPAIDFATLLRSITGRRS